MKSWLMVGLVLLSACKPESAPPPADSSAAEAPASAPAPVVTSASEPASTNSGGEAVEPISQTHGGAAPPAPAAAGEVDDHTAVNRRITEVLGDAARYETAILAFQQAVQQKDAATIATMIDFPFKTHVEGKPVTVRDAPAFIAQYGRIVTPQMAEAIVRQRYSELFVNQKGIMFGRGEAWLNGNCVDAECTSANVRVVALQPVR